MRVELGSRLREVSWRKVPCTLARYAHSPRSHRSLIRIASGLRVGGVRASRAPPSTAPRRPRETGRRDTAPESERHGLRLSRMRDEKRDHGRAGHLSSSPADMRCAPADCGSDAPPDRNRLPHTPLRHQLNPHLRDKAETVSAKAVRAGTARNAGCVALADTAGLIATRANPYHPAPIQEIDKMTRNELSANLAAETSMAKTAADHLLRVLHSAIGQALTNYDPASIAGFGKFAIRSCAARQDRYPQTEEPVAIPASRVQVFNVPNATRDAVPSTPINRARPSGPRNRHVCGTDILPLIWRRSCVSTHQQPTRGHWIHSVRSLLHQTTSDLPPATPTYRRHRMTMPLSSIPRVFASAIAILLSLSAVSAQEFQSHFPKGARITVTTPTGAFLQQFATQDVTIDSLPEHVSEEGDVISRMTDSRLRVMGDSLQLIYDMNQVNEMRTLLDQGQVAIPQIHLPETPQGWGTDYVYSIDLHPIERSAAIRQMRTFVNMSSNYPLEHDSAEEIQALRSNTRSIENAVNDGTLALSDYGLDTLRAEYIFLTDIINKLQRNNGDLLQLTDTERNRFRILQQVTAYRNTRLEESSDQTITQAHSLYELMEVHVSKPTLTTTSGTEPASGYKVERYVPYKDRHGNFLQVQTIGTSTPASGTLTIAHACYYAKDSEGEIVSDVVSHYPRERADNRVDLRLVGKANVSDNRHEYCER